jgi:hypothetical protein
MPEEESSTASVTIAEKMGTELMNVLRKGKEQSKGTIMQENSKVNASNVTKQDTGKLIAGKERAICSLANF